MKQLIIVILLVAIVYLRTEFFSVEKISLPLVHGEAEPLSEEAEAALLQKYRYLGKGRQSYAFSSEDGKWVVKFFRRSYLNAPPKALAKRWWFYQNSYRIASKLLKNETAIVYLHQSISPEPLPHLTLTDRGGRSHRVDLQKTPFVLQRKAQPLFGGIRSFSQSELTRAIEQFFSLIKTRIDRKIRDGDHQIKDNFGVLDGKVMLIDPGRIYLDEKPWDAESLREEWINTTHRFKKWLMANAPDQVAVYETTLKTYLEKYQ